MILYSILIFLLGLCLGSFVNALVWRLHQNSKTKSKNKLSIINGRSICVNCKHKLSALDLAPVFSWIFLRGKCRYCKKPISIQYPLIEIITAILFVLSYYFWSYGFKGLSILQFVFWLIILTNLIALALYDLKWYILPTKLIYWTFLFELFYLVTRLVIGKDFQLLLGSIIGFVILGGLFYFLFQISQGNWIGGGDIRLGGLLGFLVGGPLAAILLLFGSSLLGTIYALPFLASGKYKGSTKVPFGPFLIISAFIVFFFGAKIISWYKGLFI